MDYISALTYYLMVATTPGEKLLIGRHRMRNWSQLHWQSLIQTVGLTPYDIKLVFVQKICS